MKYIWFLLITLFITGCTAGGGAQLTGADFRTGSQALEMRFLQQNFEIFEGDELSLALEYRNRGTHDITDGTFFVKGFDSAYISPQFNPSNAINIQGKDEFDPVGQLTQIVTLDDTRVSIPENRDRFDQELQVVACYVYRTEASIPVCIDPDPTNRRIEQKVCQGAPVGGGAQGHPVVVTLVDPRTSRSDIRFNIEIQNAGDGIVFDNRISDEKCAFDLEAQDTNRVFVRKVSFSNINLDCQPNNPITLNNGGRGIFACSCVNCLNENDGAFQTALTVELEYGYRNVQSAFVTILSDDIG